MPEAARWASLRAAAKPPDIGKRIDDPPSLIEAEYPKLKGILDKRFARAQLPDGKLGALVDLVSTVGVGSSAAEAEMQALTEKLGAMTSGACHGYTKRCLTGQILQREAPQQGQQP